MGEEALDGMDGRWEEMPLVGARMLQTQYFEYEKHGLPVTVIMDAFSNVVRVLAGDGAKGEYQGEVKFGERGWRPTVSRKEDGAFGVVAGGERMSEFPPTDAGLKQAVKFCADYIVSKELAGMGF